MHSSYAFVYIMDYVMLLLPKIIDIRIGRFVWDRYSTEE